VENPVITNTNVTNTNVTKPAVEKNDDGQFLHTDNPDSIQNRPANTREPVKRGDYLDAISGGQNGRSWTVPPHAGGADSFSDGPLASFCNLVGMPCDSLPDRKRKQWATELRRLADAWQIGPSDLRACVEALSESEFGWKTYSTPYQKSFQDDVSILIGRQIAGEPLFAEPDEEASSVPDMMYVQGV